MPAAGVVLTDVPFYDKSTVGVFGADLGFVYDVNKSVALGIEAGLRYQTGPSDLEGLAGTGLEPINDTGSRWSLPVTATRDVPLLIDADSAARTRRSRRIRAVSRSEPCALPVAPARARL